MNVLRVIAPLLVCAALLAAAVLGGCQRDKPLIDGRVSGAVPLPR